MTLLGRRLVCVAGDARDIATRRGPASWARRARGYARRARVARRAAWRGVAGCGLSGGGYGCSAGAGDAAARVALGSAAALLCAARPPPPARRCAAPAELVRSGGRARAPWRAVAACSGGAGRGRSGRRVRGAPCLGWRRGAGVRRAQVGAGERRVRARDDCDHNVMAAARVLLGQTRRRRARYRGGAGEQWAAHPMKEPATQARASRLSGDACVGQNAAAGGCYIAASETGAAAGLRGWRGARRGAKRRAAGLQAAGTAALARECAARVWVGSAMWALLVCGPPSAARPPPATHRRARLLGRPLEQLCVGGAAEAVRVRPARRRGGWKAWEPVAGLWLPF